MVQEFAQLTPDNVVFKQIGPALIKQDQAEAKSNVDTRLSFIQAEMCAEVLLMLVPLANDPDQKARRRAVEGHPAKTRKEEGRGSWLIARPRRYY